ncbi:putative potassium transport system protein kup 1 [Roseisolibacter agri]|uniref:Probable potassium transport system protein Kup n=2 Tax=Roseisolibacter agri TaxID=2014610 RepID=A0AA37QCA7_9BACT|nr:potassium transporter Kup [Roseisolibacter agri]GLC27121.1 putative potassium transport system protein kup 1 [Roseisolibacter agri]
MSTTAETPTTLHPHASHHRPEENPTGRKLAVLTLTALGVVYGDIGTSPLYSIQECFREEFGLAPSIANVYGVLSLIVWSLVLVVSVKYVMFILRADNKGEGGVYALLALLLQRQNREGEAKRRALLIALGLFGGAFLYGDGIITPAISVLGAVNGISVVAPALGRFVVPISFAIIAALFYFQYKGTAKVGGAFGWIMLTWFLSIGLLGIAEIVNHPEVFTALNPWHAITFFTSHPTRSFVVLGAVVLVITGGEALYADMGHFGRKPIRLAWFGFVLPCLLLNYFGQGALLIRDPSAVANPFYLLAPKALQIPLLVVATLAAIVASQALISGAFSLTQQAIQLGYVPRLQIIHTSHEQAGQIYIPEVNKALAIGTLLLVVTFRSAAALAATYGVAVTATMAITTILFALIARQRFGWSRAKMRVFLYGFLAIDLMFFASNLLKVPHGGWVPLGIAALVFLLMTTWKRGREILQELLQKATIPMDMFLADVARRQPPRVPGTAVFMTSTSGGAPVVLLHHLKHNKVLHEQVVLLSIRSAEVPDVDEEETLEVEKLGHGFYRVAATYGFMETPDVPQVMKFLNSRGIRARPNETSYYLGRERLLPSGKTRMMRWRKKLFVFMSRNARSATEFFNIPPNRVVELGTQVEF